MKGILKWCRNSAYRGYYSISYRLTWVTSGIRQRRLLAATITGLTHNGCSPMTAKNALSRLRQNSKLLEQIGTRSGATLKRAAFLQKAEQVVVTVRRLCQSVTLLMV